MSGLLEMFRLAKIKLDRRNSLARDSDDQDVIFRTIDSGQTLAFEGNELVGGGGYAVGPDKLPVFSVFVSVNKLDESSTSKNVRLYVEKYIQPIV